MTNPQSLHVWSFASATLVVLATLVPIGQLAVRAAGY